MKGTHWWQALWDNGLAKEMEAKSIELDQFLDRQNLKQILKLDVSGHQINVSRDTLTKVPGSK